MEGPHTVTGSPDLLLAVDCSTSGAKAVLFTADGRSVASGKQSFALDRPAPGRHEQNADDWWTATSAAIARAVEDVDPTRVAALVVTHQRETFVCLDADGRPLRPAIVWADGRSVPQVARYGSDETHRISGRVPDITPSIFKLAWLREHEPQTLQRSARIGDVSAFLNEKLTGRWVTSASSGDSMGLMDLATQRWSQPLCDIAGVDRSQLPEIVSPGTILGALTPDVAAQLNLAEGTSVVAGAGDGQCAALGSGLADRDAMYLNVGTALVAGYASPEYLWSRRYRTVLDAPGRGYLLETFTQSGTYLISWFVDRFSPSLLAENPVGACEVAREEDLEKRAAAIAPGCDGLVALPYWNGAQTPYWDGDARGAVIGWSGAHTGAHLYRALLEGIAFETRLQTDGVEADTGVEVTHFLTTGGGSRSATWSQLIADVTGRRLDICAESETTALGAAMLAACAIGLHQDLTTAAHEMARVERTFTPRPGVAATYEPLYQRYMTIYPALRELFQAAGTNAIDN